MGPADTEMPPDGQLDTQFQTGGLTAQSDVSTTRESLDGLLGVKDNHHLGDICGRTSAPLGLVAVSRPTRSDLQTPSDACRGDTARRRPASVRQTSDDQSGSRLAREHEPSFEDGEDSDT